MTHPSNNRRWTDGPAGTALATTALPVFLILSLLAGFPGGTIFMGCVADHSNLTTFDWVMSVAVPFYGIIVGLANR